MIKPKTTTLEQEKRKRTTDTWKMGTWNVRGLQGKEQELVDEFENANLQILSITETKRKGKGMMELGNGHILVFSGVQQGERAKSGVGCIINKKWKGKITMWEAITDRILIVQINMGIKENTNIITIYAPNEDDRVETRNKFWEELTLTLENAKGKVIIAGDFNSRVGIKDKTTASVLGIHGEETRSNNGKKMIEFCILNNMIITNTFYQHKEKHKYTRVAPTRQEKSIIDYILVEKKNRRDVRDVRVKRGLEINSDHYALVAVMNREKEQTRRDNITNPQHITVKTYKLREKETANKYKQIEEELIAEAVQTVQYQNIEQTWETFKNILLTATKLACGTNSINKNRKQTRWWNKEIKEQVKIKKSKWLAYLSKKDDVTYREYKEQRTTVKKIVKQSKMKSWEEFGNRMERNHKEHQKLFYKVLKSLRVGRDAELMQMKDVNGKLLTENCKIMQRWREYFQELLGTSTTNIIEEEEEEHQTGQTENNDGNTEGKITEEELQEAVRKMKNGKAPGHDQISAEMVKLMGPVGRKMLLQLINEIWKQDRIPKDWELGIIMPVHKAGDKMKCENYRGITLMCTVAKIYERILEKRLSNKIQGELIESQSGFRRGHSVQDHIFTLKQITEKIKIQNRDAFFCFIDLEKAFDRVQRQQIWESMKNRGVDSKLIKAIKSTYVNTRNYVRTRNSQSEEFVTHEGLKQGGVLSPTLFNIIMDEILKMYRTKAKRLQVGYRNMRQVTITECAFADDVIICAGSEEDMNTNLKWWAEIINKFNMKMNVKKTKMMHIGREAKYDHIQIDGTTIEMVESFKYLGVAIDRSGMYNTEVTNRITAAMKLYHAIRTTFINKKEITRKTKMSVYKSIFRPILLYGSESWVLTTSMKSSIQATEMKYLRRVMGITRMDRVRNQDIQDELKVDSVLKEIEKNQLKWFGHLCRMGDEAQVKCIWEAKVTPRRQRGRPRQTWDSTVQKILQEKDKTWKEARRMTIDRKQWAKFVSG